jgi:hypothetical protein
VARAMTAALIIFVGLVLFAFMYGVIRILAAWVPFE